MSKQKRKPKRMITLATGQGTFDVKDHLKRHGFRWNAMMKAWIRLPALHDADRKALVNNFRRLGHADRVELKTIDWEELRESE